MYKIGWFSSGRDKAARDLLSTVQASIKKCQIKADISFVFLSCEPGESIETDRFIELVKSYHIPLICFSYQKYKSSLASRGDTMLNSLPKWRLDYDREVMKRLEGFKVDICVLAGYMLIVGREMCQKYDMINLHPALPGGPTGSWQDVIWKLIDNRSRESGVMMHLVTTELDRGPVITYCRFSIKGGTFDTFWNEIGSRSTSEIKAVQGQRNKLFLLIREQGLNREFPLITSTLKSLSSGKIKIANRCLFDSQGKAINGYELTAEMDKILAGG